MPKFSISLLLCGFILCFTQCKNKQETAAPPATAPESVEVRLTPFDSSASFPDAAISSMDYQKGKFTFKLTGNYVLGEQTPDAPQKMCANSAQGQHIHLIVDNKPYEARYVPEFQYKIEDGSHYILAFLSRSYHESIKSTKASVLIQAEIKDSSFKKLNPVSAPMIFYSRPKGVYIGADTKKVMLDFYVANCRIGGTFKVKAEINGKEFMIDTWQPYYMEGLPMGENKIKLSLVDSTGQLVNSPLNPVERSFTLQAEPNQQ